MQSAVSSLWIAAIAVVATLVVGARPVTAEPVIVSTLEWPPYTSAKLPRGGATTEVIRQAFAASGLELGVEYLPWKRAISTAKTKLTVVAYFPGYHCRHVEGFVASEPIGNGPLGFAENSLAPVKWLNVDDLGEQRLRVGTVLGYANTDEFDEKAGTGWVRAIPAADDVTNLRKLFRQRIDLAVIDKLVLSYILATDSSLLEAAEVLKFNPRALEDKTLYLCFNDDEAGRALRDKFNSGLAQVDSRQIVDDYFANEF